MSSDMNCIHKIPKESCAKCYFLETEIMMRELIGDIERLEDKLTEKDISFVYPKLPTKG